MLSIPRQSLLVSRVCSRPPLRTSFFPLRSSHCSPSSSRILLRRLPTFAPLLLGAAMSATSDTSTSSSTTAAADGSQPNNSLPDQRPSPSPSPSSSPALAIRPLPRAAYPAQISFSPQDLSRADERPDAQFYAQPRFVQHLDDGAVASLQAYYGAAVRAGDRVVDLCASWTSHLPAGLRGRLASCVGYGLSAREMAANGHLTGYWVRDLNAGADAMGAGGGGLLREVPDGAADVVVCSVSVDYLVRPLEVMAEVRRCLKAGGTAHMAFSNRCFPTKVIARWLAMGDEERRSWVGGYFWAAGGFEDVEEVILRDSCDGNDPLFVIRARRRARDD